jgi:hypothetical protein
MKMSVFVFSDRYLQGSAGREVFSLFVFIFEL